MTNASEALQQAMIAALSAHPALSNVTTGIYDDPPARASFPFIAIGDNPVSDWSTKTAIGREVRFALTVWDDGENPARLQAMMGHVEDAMAALPRDLTGWRIASNVYLRSLISRDADGPWAGLVESRVRMLAV